jgi:hypothetical protein
MTMIDLASRWHPWRTLGVHWPHVPVVYCRLPDGQRGETDGATIWLDNRLSQTQRRCVLTHELWHLRRGTVAATSPAEEHLCDVLAARELITAEALAHGLRWTRTPADLARALWVDEHALRVRMTTLTAAERAELGAETVGAWWQWE